MSLNYMRSLIESLHVIFRIKILCLFTLRRSTTACGKLLTKHSSECNRKNARGNLVTTGV